MKREDVLTRNGWRPEIVPLCPSARRALAHHCENCGSLEHERAEQVEHGLEPHPIVDRHLTRCLACGRIESHPHTEDPGPLGRIVGHRRLKPRPVNKPWRDSFVLYPGRPVADLPALTAPGSLDEMAAKLIRVLDDGQRAALADMIDPGGDLDDDVGGWR